MLCDCVVCDENVLYVLFFLVQNLQLKLQVLSESVQNTYVQHQTDPINSNIKLTSRIRSATVPLRLVSHGHDHGRLGNSVDGSILVTTLLPSPNAVSAPS